MPYKTLAMSHKFLKRSAYWLLYVTGVLLFLVALPGDADAVPGYEVHHGGTKLVLPVEHTTDHVISVWANGRQRVQLLVKLPSSMVEYSTAGRVSNHHIEADFGAFGRIDVRLNLRRHPHGVPHRGRCKGHAPFYQDGTYQGSIELSAEGRVPEVLTERGHVYFERTFRQVCKRRRQSAAGGKDTPTHTVEAGVLTVAGRAESRTIFLQALNLTSRMNPQHSAGNLEVVAHERLEGVKITQRITVPVDHGSFAMSPPGSALETVELTPPAPFAGQAVYARPPASPPSWTGDLALDLPDGNSIPLTGADLTAAFCRGFSISALRRCLDPRRSQSLTPALVIL